MDSDLDHRLHRLDLKSGSEHRTAWIQVSESMDRSRRYPVVMLLHGRTGSGRQVAHYTRMLEKADAENFIAVYPDALGHPPGWNAVYNSGRYNGDDRGFLEKLLDQVLQKHPCDASRIYIAGHSSGAMMTYYYGALHADRLAAIAVVAGSIGAQRVGEPYQQIPDPLAPIPLLAIHGRRDAIVPYGEEDRARSKYSHFMPVPYSIAFWAAKNHCSPVPEVHRLARGKVIEERYQPRPGGAEVVLCTLSEGNHHWPGGRSMPETGPIQPNTELSATDRIWEFFASKSRPH